MLKKTHLKYSKNVYLLMETGLIISLIKIEQSDV